MSTTIRISDEVLTGLQRLQQPRESYSDLILRLIRMVTPLLEAAEIMSSRPSIIKRLGKEEG